MWKSEESSVEESWNFKTYSKLNEGKNFKTSFMSNFPKLEMLILYCKFTKPDRVNNVNNHQ